MLGFYKGGSFCWREETTEGRDVDWFKKVSNCEGKEKKTNPELPATVKPRLFDLCFTDKTFLIPAQRNMGKTSSYKPEISCNR